MAILTGPEIRRQIELGRIIISPLPRTFNPNSVNLTLAPLLRRYLEPVLDCRKDNPTFIQEIPDEGLVLQPGRLYLGSTNEWTESPFHAPMIEGRSSLARLGMKVHLTAGFGDVGFRGHWTLEIEVAHPLRIYPNIEICQICFHTVEGEIRPYQGKYQNQESATASRLYLEK